MKRFIIILLTVIIGLPAAARLKVDSTIYQGWQLRLDLGTPLIEIGTSRGHNIDVELSTNVRLANRYYPTLEVGFAKADRRVQREHFESRHLGEGGFFRVGIDINGLKKHPERLDGLMAGVRLGTSMQNYQLTGVPIHDPLDPTRYRDFSRQFRADCWGEVVLGCQVNIVSRMMMGWYFRLKMLLTKNAKEGNCLPYYIPGYGYRSDTNWGVSYYIGIKI